ncbi:MAG: hypothetical protein HY080_11160 [Gammaproteobacteria bacterium]|nr:hypothetical protein [Gammaproteobacteria bacterium]
MNIQIVSLRKFGAILGLTLMLLSPGVKAHADIDIQVFYDELAPYGTWIDHPRYHWVWSPSDMPTDWRPYSQGHWANTLDHGWVWVSDQQWGWAPFHYGRWFFDTDYGGWLWVPGRVWGPGWVAWRSGGEYIGWAPLPPEAEWDEERGLVTDDLDDYYGVEPDHWVFIEERYFLAPRLYRYEYLPPRNLSIIQITNNITNFTVVDHRIVNHCVDVRHIEHITRQPVRVWNVNEVSDIQRVRHTHYDVNTIPVYRPGVKEIRRQEQPIKQFSPPQLPINGSWRDTRPIRESHESVWRRQEQPIKPWVRANEPNRVTVQERAEPKIKRQEERQQRIKERREYNPQQHQHRRDD